jgi:hypothetical protein
MFVSNRTSTDVVVDGMILAPGDAWVHLEPDHGPIVIGASPASGGDSFLRDLVVDGPTAVVFPGAGLPPGASAHDDRDPYVTSDPERLARATCRDVLEAELNAPVLADVQVNNGWFGRLATTRVDESADKIIDGGRLRVTYSSGAEADLSYECVVDPVSGRVDLVSLRPFEDDADDGLLSVLPDAVSRPEHIPAVRSSLAKATALRTLDLALSPSFVPEPAVDRSLPGEPVEVEVELVGASSTTGIVGAGGNHRHVATLEFDEGSPVRIGIVHSAFEAIQPEALRVRIETRVLSRLQVSTGGTPANVLLDGRTIGLSPATVLVERGRPHQLQAVPAVAGWLRGAPVTFVADEAHEDIELELLSASTVTLVTGPIAAPVFIWDEAEGDWRGAGSGRVSETVVTGSRLRYEVRPGQGSGYTPTSGVLVVHRDLTHEIELRPRATAVAPQRTDEEPCAYQIDPRNPRDVQPVFDCDDMPSSRGLSGTNALQTRAVLYDALLGRDGACPEPPAAGAGCFVSRFNHRIARDDLDLLVRNMGPFTWRGPWTTNGGYDTRVLSASGTLIDILLVPVAATETAIYLYPR